MYRSRGAKKQDTRALVRRNLRAFAGSVYILEQWTPAGSRPRSRPVLFHATSCRRRPCKSTCTLAFFPWTSRMLRFEQPPKSRALERLQRLSSQHACAVQIQSTFSWRRIARPSWTSRRHLHRSHIGHVFLDTHRPSFQETRFSSERVRS